MMQRFTLTLCAVALLANLAAAQQPKAAAPEGAGGLKTTKDKASYAIGLNIGRSIARDGLTSDDLDPAIIAAGLRDALSKAKPQLSNEEIQAVMREFQQAVTAKQEEQRKNAAATNQQAGEAFLAENAKRKGVKTLESGLQYEVLKSGTGATPKPTDRVTTHYHGTLIDGTVFDSSVERKQPATFGVNQVIKGWTEALQLMKVGDKWRLFVPSDLAYGDRGAGDDIGPNTALIFEVELLGIK